MKGQNSYELTSLYFSMRTGSKTGQKDWNERGTCVIIRVGIISDLAMFLFNRDRMHVFDFLPLGARTRWSDEGSLP